MRKERIIGPIIFILLWYFIYFIGMINPLFLPSPHSVIASTVNLFFSQLFWLDLFSSLLRIFISFAISLFIGIPIGLLMGYYKKINNSFELLVDFFRSLPALAIFPLFMFLFGIGDSSKIATAVFSCTFIITINTIYGVIQCKKTRQITAYLMGASKWEVFSRIIFMDSLPQIVVGIRTSISMSVIVIIVTEMFIGTNNGIGYRIFEAQQTYKVSELYSYIVIAGMIGYLLNQIIIRLENRIIHWSGKS